MNYLLQDEIVGLKKIEINDDLSNYHKWFNTQESNRHNSHGIFPLTLKQIHDYISVNLQTSIHLSLFIKETEEHIGNISLNNIDYINRKAELTILIGSTNDHNKGYSYRACKLLIDHAFNRINLNRVYCATSQLNLGMQKLAIKLGMLQEGIRKGALFSEGKYVNIIEFGVLRSND